MKDSAEARQGAIALEASEKRYRRLFEAARDGILILDAATGQIVDVNPYLVEVTGYSKENFLGKHLWEIGPFRDMAASREQFAELQILKYVRYEDLPLKTSDGRIMDVEFISNVYRVDDQDVIQCNIRDITARKAAEAIQLRTSANLKMAQQALQQNQQQFQVLFEHAADSILLLEMVADGNPIILDVNQKTLSLLGWDRFELIGQSTAFLQADHDIYRVIAEELGNAPPGAGVGFEVRHTCKDGTIREFEGSLQQIKVGPRTFGISIERDTTGRRAAEATSRHHQKLESIGTLASGVAHEINNPLNVVMNYCQLILDDPTDPEQVRDYAGNVLKESERMAAIVHNLLDFARQNTEQYSPARIADIVNKTLSLVQVTLRNDQIKVQFEIPVGLPTISCRSQQIQQVLMNLLTNSRDALNERYPKTDPDKLIRIIATTFHKNGADWVRLTVDDHGGGILPKVTSQVFDPFFTTKGRHHGTGLGLSISHGIIREHKGELSFQTEPGMGTQFHIDLPADMQQPLEDPAHSSAATTH